MAIKIKVQRDYLLTEFSVEATISELDDVLRAMKTSGKMVTLYNNGSVQGVNVEQKTKLTEDQSLEVRKLIGIESREL